MDIWRWVWDLQRELRAAGRADLADAVERFPRECRDGDGGGATAPTLLSAAAELELPWLGVFTRHWLLQGKGATGGLGTASLSAAVEALELANRSDTRDCPQSICTTQDLSLCYAAADGIGWAAERLAVVDETLARIDPTWPCWECLVDERVGALTDLGRLDEAGAALDRLPAERRTAGVEPTDLKLLVSATYLFDMGRYEDAAERVVRNWKGADTERISDQARLVYLHSMAKLGRIDELGPELIVTGVTFDELDRNPRSGPRWVAAAEELVGLGRVPNDAGLGVRVRAVVEDQLERGAHRLAWDAAGTHVRLAVARGARSTARRGLELGEAARAGLRFPASVDDELGRLRLQVEALPELPLPVPADRLAEHLDGADDLEIEQVADWLETAVSERPDDSELVGRWAGIVSLVGGVDAVASEMVLRLAADPDQPELAAAYLGMLVRATSDPSARLDELASLLEGVDPATSLWARAWAARRRGDDEACLRACREIVELDPDAVNTRRLAASACTDLGRLDEAVGWWREVCDRTEVGDDDWSLMVAATRAGDWAQLRWAARRVGMEVAEGDEPLDEAWEVVDIRPLGGSSDGRDDLLALRTGPVSARILAVIEPGQGPQRTRDEVVFDARPLEPPPEDPDAPWTPTFAEVAVTRRGDWNAWAVFVADPGDEAWPSLAQELRGAGHELWAYSGRGAQVSDPDGARTSAVYGAIAAAPDVSPLDLHRLLHSLTSSWTGFRAWPQLATAAELGGDVVEAHWGAWNDHEFV